MATAAGGTLNQIPFEVPDLPHKFGQDGGRFYRLYDNLAEEIDEDMAKGLKEQLDGLLIFAGLFAGVNSAFLALTLPLLLADPADDTNALLAQNNAILMQLMQGRNDTSLGNSSLPSTSFSPSHGIFTVNVLFSFSLTLAIISSFLAVLGRQWLIYYRKRSGGGPDRQRWEQLKRFLGAERWRLEFILDDILPSLLQIGLIIFCVSLILYLHVLNPSISRIVGIPMCLGLAIFVLGALFTVWDRFCPFQSPLSHLLCWLTNHLLLRPSPIRQIISKLWPKFLLIVPIIWVLLGFLTYYVAILLIPVWLPLTGFAYLFGLPVPLITPDTFLVFEKLFDGSERGSGYLTGSAIRETKNEVAFLQVAALKRTIRTSDDPLTLLCATANMLTIDEKKYLEELWSDETFRSRFVELCTNPYQRIVQLLGRDRNEAAISAARLYRGALCHMILLLDLDIWDYYGFRSCYYDVGKAIVGETLDDSSWLIPPGRVSGSSPVLIETALASWMLRACVEYVPLERIGSRIVEYSDSLSASNWKLVSLIVYILTKFPYSDERMRINQDESSADMMGPTQYISTVPGQTIIIQQPPQLPLQTGRQPIIVAQPTGIPVRNIQGPTIISLPSQHVPPGTAQPIIVARPTGVSAIQPQITGGSPQPIIMQGTSQTVPSADMTGPIQHISTGSGEAIIIRIQPPPQAIPLQTGHVDPPPHVVSARSSVLNFGQLRSAYTRNVGMTLTDLEKVAIDLARQQYAGDLDCHRILQNIMRCAREIISDESQSLNARVPDKLGLLDIAEQVLRIEEIPVQVRATATMLRKDFVTMLRLRFMTGDVWGRIPSALLVLLGNLFFKLGARDENSQLSNEEDLQVLQLFGPLLRELYSYPTDVWKIQINHGSPSASPMERLKNLCDEVRQVYDQFTAKSDGQCNRDPEISGRHRMEELDLDLPAQQFSGGLNFPGEGAMADDDWTGLEPIWHAVQPRPSDDDRSLTSDSPIWTAPPTPQLQGIALPYAPGSPIPPSLPADNPPQPSDDGRFLTSESHGNVDRIV